MRLQVCLTKIRVEADNSRNRSGYSFWVSRSSVAIAALSIS